MNLLEDELRKAGAKSMTTDYKSLVELCATGEAFGLTCPKCGSPMLICETNPRLMMCKTMSDVSFAACSTRLIETPSYGEFKEAMIHAKISPVATWTRKLVRAGVTKKGKARRVRAYEITGRTRVCVRDPSGDVFALRFLKRAFVVDRFTEQVAGEATKSLPVYAD